MNLSGFCAADEPTCNYRAPGSPTPTYNPLGPCPAGLSPQPCDPSEGLDLISGCCTPFDANLAQALKNSYPGLVAQTTSYLYSVAARVGKQYICPDLPFIGGKLMAAAGLPLLPAEISIPWFGSVIALSTELALNWVGTVIGKDVQKALCGP
ncbi:MAG: hypothetical protein WA459_00205 [Stellaceae bacterium]